MSVDEGFEFKELDELNGVRRVIGTTVGTRLWALVGKRGAVDFQLIELPAFETQDGMYFSTRSLPTLNVHRRVAAGGGLPCPLIEGHCDFQGFSLGAIALYELAEQADDWDATVWFELANLYRLELET